jgi:large subunit ribosomal protein L25
MASAKFEIEATVRHDLGKGASRRLRREEKVPAVVYGGGKASVALTIEHSKMIRALEDEAFYSRILTLKTHTESEHVVLKDLQRHPYKRRLLHLDFQRVRADEKLHMHVPLHFLGGDNSPGVKAGGIISHIMSDVEVSCLPDHLPEYLELDLTNLELNQILHLSDITLPLHVELVALSHDDDKPVVSVHIPRALEEPEVTAETPISADVPASEQKSEEETPKSEE